MGGVGVGLIQTPSAVAFRELVDSTPQVMAAIKSLDGRYVYVNAGFAQRLGKPASAVIGQRVTDLFSPDLARSYAEQDALVVRSGRPMQGHLELIVRADGTLGWYVTSKSLLRDDDGTALGIAVLSIDLHSQMMSTHAGLARVIASIRAQIHRPWRVAEMAKVAGLSSTQLERLCRRTLGLPPQRLLQRLRLEHAVGLITSTDLPLATVAAECGFYDQATFTRQFRSVLGLTPGMYRRMT